MTRQLQQENDQNCNHQKADNDTQTAITRHFYVVDVLSKLVQLLIVEPLQAQLNFVRRIPEFFEPFPDQLDSITFCTVSMS